MKLIQANLVKAMAIALLVIAPSSARAVMVPTGLNPGDTYHLAFLTDGTRDAIPASIGAYNTFVQDEAALNPSLTGTNDGVQWFVIGSTFGDDARDNALVSAPVYLLDGTTKVADDFADMWDGSIDNPIDVDQYGSIAGSPDVVFAGSQADGTKFFPSGQQRFLGSTSNVQLGDPTATNTEWIFDPGASLNSDLRSFYALSEVLTVVPEPATGSLIASGVLALFWHRRRVSKR